MKRKPTIYCTQLSRCALQVSETDNRCSVRSFPCTVVEQDLAYLIESAVIELNYEIRTTDVVAVMLTELHNTINLYTD